MPLTQTPYTQETYYRVYEFMYMAARTKKNVVPLNAWKIYANNNNVRK